MPHILSSDSLSVLNKVSKYCSNLAIYPAIVKDNNVTTQTEMTLID